MLNSYGFRGFGTLASIGTWHSGCRVHSQWHEPWGLSKCHEYRNASHDFAASIFWLGLHPDHRASFGTDPASQHRDMRRSNSHRIFCFSYWNQPFINFLVSEDAGCYNGYISWVRLSGIWRCIPPTSLHRCFLNCKLAKTKTELLGLDLFSYFWIFELFRGF